MEAEISALTNPPGTKQKGKKKGKKNINIVIRIIEIFKKKRKKKLPS